MKKLLSLLFAIFFISCFNTNNEASESETSSFSLSHSNDDGYTDGSYEAKVDYNNPETGTSSSYTLEVEVENGELTVIHWPNGGWLDSSHFSTPDITSGFASFESDEGYEYEVILLDKLD